MMRIDHVLNRLVGDRVPGGLEDVVRSTVVLRRVDEHYVIFELNGDAVKGAAAQMKDALGKLLRGHGHRCSWWCLPDCLWHVNGHLRVGTHVRDRESKRRIPPLHFDHMGREFDPTEITVI